MTYEHEAVDRVVRKPTTAASQACSISDLDNNAPKTMLPCMAFNSVHIAVVTVVGITGIGVKSNKSSEEAGVVEN